MGIKVLAIVQARMGSTRLPNKVLLEIKGMSIIEILLYRLSKSKKINKIILGTSLDKDNDILCSKVSETVLIDSWFKLFVFDAKLCQL